MYFIFYNNAFFLSIILIIVFWLCWWSLLWVIISRTSSQSTWSIWKAIFIWQSYCDSGKHVLKRYQLIPIISYIWQWWICIKCKTRIPLRYGIIECVTAITFLYATTISLDIPMLFYLVFVRSCLIIIAFVDIDNQTLHIPSWFMLLILHVWIMILHYNSMILISWICSLIIFGGIYIIAKWYAQYRYSMTEWFWQWDVMLAPLLAMSLVLIKSYMWFSVDTFMIITDIINMLIMASMIGILWYFVWHIKSQKNQTLPFLPCMIFWYVMILLLQRAW